MFGANIYMYEKTKGSCNSVSRAIIVTEEATGSLYLYIVMDYHLLSTYLRHMGRA